MMVFSFWWIAGAVAVFWVIGAHNRLVRLRAAVLPAFAALHLALQQWADLAISAGPGSDAALEHGVARRDSSCAAAVLLQTAAQAGLAASARQLQVSAQALSLRPLNRRAAEALVAAMEAVRSAWGRVAVAFEEPTAEHTALAALWQRQDTLVQLACGQFNEAAARYNAALAQFPAALLAWVLRFRPAGQL